MREVFEKPELVAALGLLLSLDAASTKDLNKLTKLTLNNIYQGCIKNARAVSNLQKEARKGERA